MDQTPIRPTWVTALMVSAGVLGAPMGVLGLALALGVTGAGESTEVAIAYGSFLALSVAVTAIRIVRPLGVGMVLGSLALAGMFLLQGGTAG